VRMRGHHLGDHPLRRHRQQRSRMLDIVTRSARNSLPEDMAQGADTDSDFVIWNFEVYASSSSSL
jgi:hypothetical protein